MGRHRRLQGRSPLAMLLVDTSVWSLALRRRHPVDSPHVVRFREALTAGEVVLPGIVMQELLQNLSDGRIKDGIVAELGKLPLLVPNRSDHRQAAELYTTCRTRSPSGHGRCAHRRAVPTSRSRSAQYRSRFRVHGGVHRTEALASRHRGPARMIKARRARPADDHEGGVTCPVYPQGRGRRRGLA